MRHLVKSIKLAFRRLWKSPVFTLVAVLTLAIGIGAVAAVFTVIDGLILRPLPIEEPEELVLVARQSSSGQPETLSESEFQAIAGGAPELETLAVFAERDFNLSGDGEEPARVEGLSVSARFFDLFRVSPRLGRTFEPGADRAGAPRRVVISHGLWQRRFAASPQVLERDLEVGGTRHRIVGVMPEEFYFPARSTQIWVPLELREVAPTADERHYLMGLGRLAGAGGESRARQQVRTVLERHDQQVGGAREETRVLVRGLQDQLYRALGPALVILFLATGFVLLIVCLNLANLQLARVAGRQRELAVRSALGARSGRIFGEVLTESLVLALVGGAAALVVLSWVMRVVAANLPANLPLADQVTVNGRVALFAFVVALLSGLLFGLLPAFRVVRTDPQEVLREGGTPQAGGGRQRVFKALLAAQVTTAVVLVTLSVTMFRSLDRVASVEPGFEAGPVMALELAPDANAYPTAESVRDLYGRLVERAEALPDVRAAAVTNRLPLVGTNNWGFDVEGRSDGGEAVGGYAQYRLVSSAYFDTLGIPLLRGRAPAAEGWDQGEPVMAVSERMASRYWGDENPVGERIRLREGDRSYRIVAVVGDIHNRGLTDDVDAEMYLPLVELPFRDLMRDLHVLAAARPGAEAAALIRPLRSAVEAVDPTMPVVATQQMSDVVARSTATTRNLAFGLGLMAVLALVLGAIGIYGLVTHFVELRRHEIAVRMALGADSRNVLRVVLGQLALLVGVGLVLGLAVSAALSQTMESLIYEVGALDPATLAAVAGVLAAVALLASWRPIVNAIRVRPAVVLRGE